MQFDSSSTYSSRRSPIASATGIVASSQVLASQIGVRILERGGTAADAAIAVAAALQVTQPCSTGIGGDCFVLYHEAASRRTYALNGSGRAPAALTLEMAAAVSRGGALPNRHPYTVTVPGAAAAWCDLAGRFGRLPLGELLEPAAELAERGCPVAPLTAGWWRKDSKDTLAKTPHGRELLPVEDGPFPGSIMRLPNLAESLRTLGEKGRAGFYEGRIARSIVESVRELGGVLSESDLAEHRSEWVEPISARYFGRKVLECPPNGQGIAVLIALNILKCFDVSALPPLSTERYHLLIEAMRLAFADAARYVADPAVSEVPAAALLSAEYARQRARLIDRKRASLPEHGLPVTGNAGDDTVYFSVLDAAGNGCSFINSNFQGFGTGIVPRGCGFSLQNRGHGFVIDKTHPNCIAPGKRPYHTIIPGMILDPENGSLDSLFGVMGGMMQPQGHLQVLAALINDELDPQASLDRPRFQLERGRPDSVVLLEDSVPAEIVGGLAALGHTVRVVEGIERPVFGLGQVITRGENELWWGGCDPRSDGCALPAAPPTSSSS